MSAKDDPTFQTLPDPVIFYDKEGKQTGQMSKAEILEKNLVLVYGLHGPKRVISEEENQRMEEEFLANGGYPKWKADWLRSIGSKVPRFTQKDFTTILQYGTRKP